MNYIPDTMKIVARKTGRQWRDDLMACLMPYRVTGGDGECPDHFVVILSGDNIATIQHTLHRKPEEDDYVFWDRAMETALELTTVQRTCQLNLYRRSYHIEIRCDYGINTATQYSDGLQNFERLLRGIAKDPQDELRKYALSLLANRYGG